MLASLPIEITSGIAAWLPAWDVRSLLFASKCLLHSPLHDVYVRHHVRLRIPPDPQHCEQLVAACKKALATSQPLPVRTMVGFPSQLQVLKTIGMQDSIDAIEIDTGRVVRLKRMLPDCVWHGLSELSCYRRLVELTVAPCCGPALDMEIIARAAPVLERFSATAVALAHEHAFTAFPYLRRLAFCGTTLHSWRLVSGLARLTHLTCDSTNMDFFSNWRPLQTLALKDVCSQTMNCVVRAIEQTHLLMLDTLRLVCRSPDVTFTLNLGKQPSLHLRELAIPPNALERGVGMLTPMTQLHTLHLCWDSTFVTFGSNNIGVKNVQPLASLVNLKTVKLRLSASATTCTPLRKLAWLRELHLVDGWLRDFVDCLPQLEKLSVEAFGDPPRQRTFLQRTDHRGSDEPSPSRYCPRLRDVFIGEHVELNDYAIELMRNAQSLQFDLARHRGTSRRCLNSTRFELWGWITLWTANGYAAHVAFVARSPIS